MGYYVDYNTDDVTIKNCPEALTAINALHTNDMLKTYASGGSWSGGEANQRWYSWVKNPPEEGFKTLEEAMSAWRFNLQDNSFYFTGEKLGDEEVLFTALAPYLEGEIYGHGEDSAEWGFKFHNGKMIGLECVRTWIER